MYKGILLCGLVIGLPKVVLAEEHQGFVKCVTPDGKTHEALNGKPLALKADKTPKTYSPLFLDRVCQKEHGSGAVAKIVIE